MMKNLRLLFLIFLLLAPVPALAASGSDNFNRADGSLGASWDNSYVYDSCRIASNRVISLNLTVSCVESYNTTFSNDQFGQLTITSLTGSVAQVAVLLRLAAPPTGTFYRVVARHGDPSASTKIQKFINSVNMGDVAAENAVTWGPGDVLRAYISTTNIVVYRNNVQVLIGSDSEITSGRVGINVVTDGSDLNDSTADDFLGGDGTGAPGASRRRVVSQR